MTKINEEYMLNSFNNTSKTYSNAVDNVGLWDSEKYVINKYIKDKSACILDMGCGAGRTTFGLYTLGYKNIIGVDFSPVMIENAKKFNKDKNLNIKFVEGNCMKINCEDNYFNYILFSFNGLMQIPKKENRERALNELYRVLKPNGILFFTTHDRDNSNEEFKLFWENEKLLWSKGNQNSKLNDFGDILSYSEIENTEYFINIPSYKEVEDMIKLSRFNLVDTFIRSHYFCENEHVIEFSSDCRFWIVKK